jgi:hypothetical protein
MSNEEEIDAAHLRELAEKCRRLSKSVSDSQTATSLRQMAAEYENLAKAKEGSSGPVPPPQIIL